MEFPKANTFKHEVIIINLKFTCVKSRENCRVIILLQLAIPLVFLSVGFAPNDKSFGLTFSLYRGINKEMKFVPEMFLRN